MTRMLPADHRRRAGSRLFRRLAGSLLLFALVGCSQFGREWRAAARPPVPTDSLAGRWEGRWVSEVSGHTGRLRALLTPTGEHTWRAHFHARYAGLFTFGYTVELRATNDAAGVAHFGGSADLGRLAGGVYTYAGRADATNFLARYESRSDHGRFEMGRPRK